MNAVLWDVLEDHLDEGAFEWGRLQRATLSPAYVLDEVADDIELPLWIHLRAICQPGAAAFERLIAPLLAAGDDTDPERFGIAALAAISLGRLDALRPALLDGSGETFENLLGAMSLHPDAALDLWSQRLAGEIAAGPARVRVLRLACRRCVPIDLSGSVRSEDADELEAAAHALRWEPRDRYLRAAERLAERGPGGARVAAAIALLQWQSPHGLRACRALASDGSGAAAATAMHILGLIGGTREHALLTDALTDPALAPDAIRSLGLSGNPAVVELLLPRLEVPADRIRRLAGEAFSLITGFDLSDPTQHAAREPLDDVAEAARALPALEDDDLDTSLVPAVEDELPILDPSAVGEFWTARRASFERDRRHLAGDPDLKRALLAQLRHGRMRDRHPLALSLALRSSGRHRLNTHALARSQRHWLLGAGELPQTQLTAYVMDW